MIPPSNAFAADPKNLETLRQQLRDQPDQGRTEVGRQFEALFIQIMLKNMRSAAITPGATDSDQSQFYQELFDTQISQQLAQGQGLGIGRQIARQIDLTPMQSPASEPAAPAGEPVLFQNLTLNRPTLTLSEQLPAPGRPSGYAVLTPAPLPAHPVSSHTGLTPSARFPDPAHLPPPPSAFARDLTPPESKVDLQHADWPPRSPAAFIGALWPHAQRAAEELGVPPKALLAQAALESGWGKHQIRHADGRPSFNLFGIKAGRGWEGARVRVATLEYTGTVSERRLEQFRAYDSLADAFADYVRLLKNNPRYQQALQAGQNHGAYAEALQRAGYATDPHYAAKIKRIMATHMAHLDPNGTGAHLA
jgi:flagellar protein FlgJ